MSSHTGILIGRGPEFDGNFIASGVDHQVIGVFDATDVPPFVAIKAKFENLPIHSSLQFHGHVGPADVHLQLVNHLNAVIYGVLAHPIGGKISVAGILTVET